MGQSCLTLVMSIVLLVPFVSFVSEMTDSISFLQSWRTVGLEYKQVLY